MTGSLVGVDAIRTLLGVSDAGGGSGSRNSPHEHCVPLTGDHGSRFDIAGLPWLADAGIGLGRWGEVWSIRPAPHLAPQVYAGGDCQRGADLVDRCGRRSARGLRSSTNCSDNS